MNKTWSALLTLLVLATVVAAAPNVTKPIERSSNDDMPQAAYVPEARQATENRSGDAGRPAVTGLENAMLRVKDNETAAHLETVLQKITDKRKEQLAKLEDLNVEQDEKTNKTIITGKGKAKFLGFIPTNKEYKYEVGENGSVVKRGKAFDFLFKTEDPLDEA